jgi:hypothetical protein
VAATGGPNSDANSVGFRQHVNAAYQGLRHIPGKGPYPLVDSFFVRGFGTGTRHRGAAVVAQITTNASYTAPTIATKSWATTYTIHHGVVALFPNRDHSAYLSR